MEGHQHSRTLGLVSRRAEGVVAPQVDILPFLTPCCIPGLVHRALSALFSEREGLSSVQTGTYGLENIPDVHVCAAGKLEEDLVHPTSKQVPCGQLCRLLDKILRAHDTPSSKHREHTARKAPPG